MKRIRAFDTRQLEAFNMLCRTESYKVNFFPKIDLSIIRILINQMRIPLVLFVFLNLFLAACSSQNNLIRGVFPSKFQLDVSTDILNRKLIQKNFMSSHIVIGGYVYILNDDFYFFILFKANSGGLDHIVWRN